MQHSNSISTKLTGSPQDSGDGSVTTSLPLSAAFKRKNGRGVERLKTLQHGVVEYTGSGLVEEVGEIGGLLKQMEGSVWDG